MNKIESNFEDINKKLQEIEKHIESLTVSMKEIDYVKEYASKDNPMAICDLAIIYFLGLDDKEPGFNRSLPLFDKASKLGDGAINFLIYYTYKGSLKFMPDMLERAEKCLKKSVKLGFEPAINEYHEFPELKKSVEEKFIAKA
jgi:TPR repeat protein